MRIAFVCHGNICRSPMAEFVFKNMIKDKVTDVFVLSRATSDEEIWAGVGNPIHRGTLEIFKKYNIPFDREKRAVQLKKSDYADFDLFIGMDNANITIMRRLFDGDPQNKVKRLLDYTPKGGEVADPWYTGDFEATYEDVCLGCTYLLAEITK